MKNIKQCLVITEEIVASKGHRLLERTGISEESIGLLIKNFKNLTNILESKKEELIPLFGEEKTIEVHEKIKHAKE